MGNASSGGLAYVPQGGAGGGVDVVIGGNTAGATASVSSGTLFLAGGNNITLSQNGQSISINGGAGAGNVNFSAGTTSSALGSVVFSNSNGVSFGLNGSTITGSIPTLAGTNTAITGNALITLNSSGLSFNGLGLAGTSTGATNASVTLNSSGIAISVGAGGGSTADFFATGNTTNNSSSVITLSSQLFNFQGGVTGGLSNGSIQISAPPISSLSGSNNISFGINGSTITASYALNVSAGGGTSNALSAITFSNSNGVSFGLSTGAGVGTMTGSVAAQSNQQMTIFATGNTTQASSQTTNASSLIFAGSGAAVVGVSGGSVIVSIATLVQFVSHIGGYAGTQTSGGISIAVPTLTRLIWPDAALTQVSAPGNASATIKYLTIPDAFTASRIDALVAMSGGSGATAATGAIAISAYAALYTRNASTLSSLSSGSTQTTYTYASNTAGQTQLTNSAIYPISVPVNMNGAPGEFFLGFNFVTATSSIGTATTNYGLTLSMMGGNNLQTALNYAEITANTATSSNLYGGMGVYTVATTGLPVSIPLAAIAQTGSSLSQANIAVVFRNA